MEPVKARARRASPARWSSHTVIQRSVRRPVFRRHATSLASSVSAARRLRNRSTNRCHAAKRAISRRCRHCADAPRLTSPESRGPRVPRGPRGPPPQAQPRAAARRPDRGGPEVRGARRLSSRSRSPTTRACSSASRHRRPLRPPPPPLRSLLSASARCAASAALLSASARRRARPLDLRLRSSSMRDRSAASSCRGLPRLGRLAAASAAASLPAQRAQLDSRSDQRGAPPPARVRPGEGLHLGGEPSLGPPAPPSRRVPLSQPLDGPSVPRLRLLRSAARAARSSARLLLLSAPPPRLFCAPPPAVVCLV